MEQAKLIKVERGVAYYQQIVAIPIRAAFGKLADDPKWKPPKRLSIVNLERVCTESG